MLLSALNLTYRTFFSPFMAQDNWCITWSGRPHVTFSGLIFFGVRKVNDECDSIFTGI